MYNGIIEMCIGSLLTIILLSMCFGIFLLCMYVEYTYNKKNSKKGYKKNSQSTSNRLTV